MPLETIYANVLKSDHKKYIFSIIRNVYHSLNESHNFLKVALKAIENSVPEISFQIWNDWREETDDEETVRDMESILRENPGAVVIRLKEPENDQDVKIFEAFIESREVSTSKNTRKARVFRVLYSNEDLGVLILDNLPPSESIYLRPNDYVIRCQMSALKNLQNNPHLYHRPLLRLFERKELVRWEDFDLMPIDEWYFLDDDSVDGVEIQRQFVQIALSTPDFAFLEGPPGSGKTTTICELILQAVKRQQRVLLAASTHVAVDNVLERIKDRKEIVAVRIGDEYRISPSVREFQIDKMKKTERRRLINSLKGIPPEKMLDSQKMLLEVLESHETSDLSLTNLILQSANLICGTTIGILQHPEIKAMRRGGHVRPIFDLLIIDESSKTTFTEFLVPALLAKRWILVGDPRQLSPYIDDAEIEANVAVILDRYLDSSEQGICLDAFNVVRSARWRHPSKLLVISEDRDLLSKYERQISYLLRSSNEEILMLRLDEDIEDFSGGKMDPLLLLGASVILATPEMARKYQDYLPGDFDLVPFEDSLPDSLKRKVEYWNFKRKKNDEFAGKASLTDERTLSSEISWRLKRYHELRFLPEDKNTYFEQIENLLPHWDFEENKELTDIESTTTELTLKEKIKRDLETIARIAFPSIIESLIKGIDPGHELKQKFTLYAGFPSEALEKRHRILRYQQRMHPDISKFPRMYIYENEALKDPRDFELKRKFDYQRYGNNRVLWIPCVGPMERGKNMNETEAKNIIAELKEFLKWAKNNPKPLEIQQSRINENERQWTVAILTFYRSQEILLRKYLRELFNNRRRHHVFKSRKFPNVLVELYTVDKYQGHEADIVFLSFVKSRWERHGKRRVKRPRDSIGFLDSVNRLNVAITRARYLLLLVGDRKYLAQQRRSEILSLIADKIRPITPLDFR